MTNYKELKDALQKEKNKLVNEIANKEAIFNKYKKIWSCIDDYNKIVDDSNEKGSNNVINSDIISPFRKFFPEFTEEFKLIEKINYHRWSLMANSFKVFNGSNLIRDMEECARIHAYPTEEMIDEMKKDVLVIEEIKALNYNRIMMLEELGQTKTMIQKQGTKIAELDNIIASVCIEITNKLSDLITEKAESVDMNALAKEIDEKRDRLDKIEKFNKMFSSDELLVKFTSDKDLQEFTDLLKSMFDTEKYKEILSKVSIDQAKEKEEIKTVNITFDNLDMKVFTDTEKEVIEEICEIIEDEELKGINASFPKDNISYQNRLESYKKASIYEVLYDVKNNLLSKIYEQKEEVIRIFRLVIELYNNYIIHKSRESKKRELLRIRDDFVSISKFIKKTRTNDYESENLINGYIEEINSDYLPLIDEVIETGYSDNDFDNMIDNIIKERSNIVRKWKKEMSLYYIDEEEVIDIKENTNNLVFCINDDIDLSGEGLQNEFVGTIGDIEIKSAYELKSAFGRKSMTRLRKDTEYNKIKDLASYLETKFHTRLHFVPYRYSNTGYYRTGLIKFEPSQVVKEYLESRYGLSKQSAVYGVFMVITTVSADHSEYANFQNYVLNNCMEIEKIAKIFASNNPNFDELNKLVDGLLQIKRDKIYLVNENSKKI